MSEKLGSETQGRGDDPRLGLDSQGQGVRAGRRRGVRRCALVFGGVVLLWVMAAIGVWRAAPPPPGPGEKFDAIIVLGAGCDGERPGKALEGRVKKAMALYMMGRAPVVMFTGKGMDDVPEAVCARSLALELGLPASAVLLEDRSTDTRGNAEEARKLMSGDRVLVVSSDFHGYRAVRIFKGLYGEVGFEGSTGSLMGTAWGSMREPAGVLKMWWEGVPTEKTGGAAKGDKLSQ
jgi:uncharacterized SAM-binding protein YcdF (DUF218 family)